MKQFKLFLPIILLAVSVDALNTTVVEALRQKLAATSKLLLVSSPLRGSVLLQNCSCEDYCTGQCFSLQCGPCSAETFSFPGGSELCLDVGPLGTGLLCHVDPSGSVSENACCTESGPTCWLPANSCCSTGDCSTCPRYPKSSGLFPPLKRYFDNNTNDCISINY